MAPKLKQEKITFHQRNIVNVYIVYEKNLRPNVLGTDFTLGNSLFGAFK